MTVDGEAFELICDHCHCGYSSLLLSAGDQCEDLSWIPNGWHARIGDDTDSYKALECAGRVWPEGSEELEAKWTDEQLAAERARMLKASA